MVQSWLQGPKSSPGLSLDTCRSEAPKGAVHAHHLAVHMCPSQTCLLTHSDRDVIVPIVLSYEGHHWPVLGGISGIDCDEFLSVILGQPVHLDGVANSIGRRNISTCSRPPVCPTWFRWFLRSCSGSFDVSRANKSTEKKELPFPFPCHHTVGWLWLTSGTS